jgi:hypothetical protein
MQKRPPTILSRPMDVRGNLDEQASERIRVIYGFYGVDLKSDDREGELLTAIIVDRFPKAFEERVPPPDRRLKVPKVGALRELVKAVVEHGEAEIPDPSLRKLALSIKSWLAMRDHKTTQKHCCEALSKLDGPWKGITPATLRDNVQRLPGARKRRAQKKSNDALRQGLRRCIREIESSTGGEPIS